MKELNYGLVDRWMDDAMDGLMYGRSEKQSEDRYAKKGIPGRRTRTRMGSRNEKT